MPKYVTRCNIPDKEGRPCGAEIVVTSGIRTPEVGQEPEAKTKAFVAAIVGHLMKKHRGIATVAMNTMEQYLAFSTLGLTTCEDPNCITFMTKFADHLCRQATMPVSDNMLLELMTRAGLTAEDQQRGQVLSLLRYVRDFQLRKIGAQQTLEAPEVQPVTP